MMHFVYFVQETIDKAVSLSMKCSEVW